MSGETATERPVSVGLWANITGRRQIEQFQKDRYKPYGYETNKTTLRWVTFFLITIATLSAVSAWFDRNNAELYSSWEEQGLSLLPSRTLDIESLQLFNERAGLNCNIAESEFSFDPSEPCGRLFEYWRLFSSSRDRVDVVFFFIVPAVIALAFAFGSFTYRANRNLLTLGSKGQRFRPEMAVLWLFIPVVNFFNPYRIFAEMFKASDPTVTDSEGSENWKKEGLAPPIIVLWQALLAATVLFNPITVYRIFGPLLSTGTQVEQIITQSWLAFSSDLLVAAFAAVTLVMAFALYLRQERKYLVVGPVVVQPTLPRDPFEVTVEKADSEQSNNRQERKNL